MFEHSLSSTIWISLQTVLVSTVLLCSSEFLFCGILGSRIPDIFFRKSGHFYFKQHIYTFSRKFGLRFCLDFYVRIFFFKIYLSRLFVLDQFSSACLVKIFLSGLFIHILFCFANINFVWNFISGYYFHQYIFVWTFHQNIVLFGQYIFVQTFIFGQILECLLSQTLFVRTFHLYIVLFCE